MKGVSRVKTVLEHFKALVAVDVEVTKEDGKVYARLSLPGGNWLNFSGDTSNRALAELDDKGVMREVAREIRGATNPHYTYIATEKCARTPLDVSGGISSEQEVAKRKLRELFCEDPGYMGSNCFSGGSAFPKMRDTILSMDPTVAEVDEYGLDSFMMHHMGM
jgi:hypothetical protein